MGMPAPAWLVSPRSLIIADSLKRRVFVLDSSGGAYRAGTDTSGPAAGVAFQLYQTDSDTALLQPLVPIGRLDITENGSGLRARAALSGILAADYTVAPSGTQATDTALVAGTLSAGARSLAVNDTTLFVRSGTASGTLVIGTIRDAAAGRSARISASLSQFDRFDFDYIFDFTLTIPGAFIRLAGEVSTFCLIPSTQAEITENGASLARVGPQTDDVVPAAGRTFTAEQRGVLLQLMAFHARVFRALAALHRPVRLLLPS
jgi:hypothetical protein